MAQVLKQIRVLEGWGRDNLPLDELLAAGQPAVFRGLAREWGLVGAGLSSAQDAMNYLGSFYNGKPVGYSYGEPQIAGRPFYNSDFTELNCIVKRDRLDEVLKQIATHLSDLQPPTYYIASLLVDGHLPGFRKDNDLGFAVRGIDPPHDLDRQQDDGFLSLRRTQQSCLLRCRQTPIHTVSTGADLQSLSGPARAFAGWPGSEPR